MVLAGCGKDEVVPPSPAGDLVVTYFQGGSPAGAILLTISGGLVESVAPIAGLPIQISYAVLAPGTTRVLVSGLPATGDLFTIRVADTTLFANYIARPDQVADHLTYSLVDLLGHTFTIHR
jgi:hypothetical protein